MRLFAPDFRSFRNRGSAGLARCVGAAPSFDADICLAAADEHFRSATRAGPDDDQWLVAGRGRRIGHLGGHRGGIIDESDAHGAAARDLDAAGWTGAREGHDGRRAALGEAVGDGERGDRPVPGVLVRTLADRPDEGISDMVDGLPPLAVVGLSDGGLSRLLKGEGDAGGASKGLCRRSGVEAFPGRGPERKCCCRTGVDRRADSTPVNSESVARSVRIQSSSSATRGARRS